MKWSWKIGQFAGIGVYMHATFLLLIGWVAMLHWRQSQSLEATLVGIGFILLLFVCVVLHEFGHALTARRYGIKTRDITLLPIGGLARLERMPDDPKQELWVALAGPAVNVVIALGLYIWLQATATFEPLSRLGVASGSFWERLMVVNLFLVGFNLLPAFPMDGGRVLRAFLASRMEYTRATQIAGGVGQAMAFLFGFIGLFTNPFLLFIAFFVWIGAAQEVAMVQVKGALQGIPVGSAMVTDFQALSVHDTLERAIEYLLAGSQQDFPVVENDEVVGVLTRSDLLVALAKKDQKTAVADVMQRDFQVSHANESLDAAFARLQGCGCHTMPVVRNGHLIGLLTKENVGEFMMIQGAIQKKSDRS